MVSSKKIAKWFALTLVLLLLVTVSGGVLLLRSKRFHEYVLEKIIEQGSEATGGRLDVADFDVRWHGLTVDVYGITLHGTESPAEPPLLTAEKLTVGMKILSFIQRKINLSEVKLEHPVAHLSVHSDGRNNLPHPNSNQQTSSSVSIFDLAVGHVAVNQGELYYNDRKSSINVDARDLAAEVSFDVLSSTYRGSLAYQGGTLNYPKLGSLPHKLSLRFEAGPTKLSVNPLTLALGSSTATLKAEVTRYDRPEVNASYAVLLHTQDFAGVLRPAATTAGDVSTTGTMVYKDDPAQSLLQSLQVMGRVSTNALLIAAEQGHLELRSVVCDYSLKDGDLHVSNASFRTLGGQLSANLIVSHLETDPAGSLRGSLNGVSFQAVRAALNNPSVRNLPLTGTASGKLEAKWSGDVSRLKANSDLRINGALDDGSTSPLPVSGEVHATYDGSTQTIGLSRALLKTRASSVTADGNISSHSNLQVHASSTNLAELESIAALLRKTSSTSSKPQRLPTLSGFMALDASIQGSMQRPIVDAQLATQNLQVENSRWKSLRVVATATPSAVTLREASLVGDRQGRVKASGTIALSDWAFTQNSPFTLQLSAESLSLQELEELSGSHVPISGDLSADISLHGTQSSPLGGGSLRIANAKAYDEPIQDLTAQFRAAGDSIDSTLTVKTLAGAAVAHVNFTPKTRAYSAEVSGPALQLGKLQTVRDKNIAVQGTASIKFNGKGTLHDPQLDALIELPRLVFRENTVTGIKAQLNVASHKANFTVSSSMSDAQIQAKGTVDLTNGYYAVASLDTNNFPLGPILVSFFPSLPNNFQGQTEVHATLRGPLQDKAKIEAHVVIPTLKAGLDTLQIANSGPIRADYSNSIITLQPSQLTGTGTSVNLQGSIPIDNANAIKVSAKGSIDLRLLPLLSPDVRSSGTLDLDVRASGSAQHPNVAGTIQVKNVSLATVSAPVGVDKLNGTLAVASDRIEIENLNGQLGGGEVSAGGVVNYRPTVGFGVTLNAKSVRLRYPVGVRSVLSSELTLTGGMQSADLKGRVLIDGVSFTQEFDLSKFMGQFGGISVPSSGESFTDHINLDVNVQSTDALSATSSAVSLEGQANLRVIGTASDPVIVGRADLNSGELFFLNRRYQLERGIINFINPNQTQPVVNMLLTTTINQYNLSLTLVGPIDKLRTSYVSDPPLPSVDIINLIARGQTTEDPSSSSSLDANSLIAQGVASQLSSSVSKLAGISSLEIDPTLGGNSRNPSARVAIQQRVSRSFVFTFSTDVTNPGNEIVQGEYQLNKRWSVSGTRDETGGIAVDGRYHTTF